MMQEQVSLEGEGVSSEDDFLRQDRVGQWVVGGTPRAAAEGPPRGCQAERCILTRQVRLRGRPGGR